MKKRRLATVAAAAIGAVLALTACQAQPPQEPTATPTDSSFLESIHSIAVIGDSMSIAVNACAEAGPCQQESWAIGTDPKVDSVATRITAATGHAPRTIAAAAMGARVGDVLGGVDRVIAQKPDLALVLIGSNDACTSTFAGMTSAAEYSTHMRDLLSKLSTGLPTTHIVVMSVPDLKHLWSIGSSDPTAVAMWSKSPSCRSLLWDAGSQASADVTRRAAVDDRVRSFNQSIATACAATPRCTTDDGAVYALQFEPADVSQIDHFHASVSGQAKLAAIAWSAVARASASASATPAPTPTSSGSSPDPTTSHPSTSGADG